MHAKLPAPILALAATPMEMEPFVREMTGHSARLVTGVGPTETAFQLCRYLERKKEPLAGVFLFGIGGAYQDAGPGMLDICVATSEVFGDVGRCHGDEVELFNDPQLTGPSFFHLEHTLVRHSMDVLSENDIRFHAGPFVTVSCASASRARGNCLKNSHNAIVENMEGAAAARVCLEYNLPFVELRVVSNMVDGSSKTTWRIGQACNEAARIAAVLINRLMRQAHTYR